MKKLAEIFNNAFFRVPDYQRGYAWQDPQLEDFWKDISWLRAGQQHYTGMLTLYPLNKPYPESFPASAPHTVYHLVDGQQRLTTAYLLLNKLVERAPNQTIGGQPTAIISHQYLSPSINGSQIQVFGYDSPTKMIFLQNILQHHSTQGKKAKKLRTKNIYERNLLQASLFLDNKLNSLSPPQMDDLFNRLTTQLVFDIHEVSNTFEVCAMFESINYRGKKLTKFEVLKNRLMYLSELIKQANSTASDRAQSLRKSIESAWGLAFDWFGTGAEPLDEDEFLLHHATMYFGALPRERDALDGKLFKEIFSNDRLAPACTNPLTLDEIEAYVESIKTSSALWAFQNSCVSNLPGSASWLTQEVADWMLRLNRLKMRHFKPLILGALNQISLDSTKETTDSLISLLKEIERFIFIVYEICEYAANHPSRTYFSDTGRAIFHREPGSSFQEIVTTVDEYLFSFDANWEYLGVFDLDEFINRVHARFHKDNGWYDWKCIKYFLSEWETHFQACPTEIMPPDDFSNGSIEHIMPQNPNAQGQWQTNQSELGKRFRYVVNDLGNISLLGIGANKAIHDIDLKCKAAAYEMSCDGKDILKRAGRKYSWGSAEILDRGASMINFMIERWRLPGQESDSEFLIDSNDVLSENVKPPRQPRKAKQPA
jgi:hypothetical protein